MKNIFFAIFLALCCTTQLYAQTEQKPIARCKAFDDDKEFIVRIYEDTMYTAELVIPYPCPLKSVTGFTCSFMSADSVLTQKTLSEPIVFTYMRGVNIQDSYVESPFCVYYLAGFGWYQLDSKDEKVLMDCKSIISFGDGITIGTK